MMVTLFGNGVFTAVTKVRGGRTSWSKVGLSFDMTGVLTRRGEGRTGRAPCDGRGGGRRGAA